MKKSPRSLFGAMLAILMVSPLGPREALAATNLCDCDLSPTAIQIDVWLDPGHDPTHKGNKGLNQNAAPPNEEDVTWEITGILNNLLPNSGYCALLTRLNFNTIYSPRQRACIASGRKMNDSGDRAFGQAMVSIHTNSGPSTRFGTTTVYPSVKSCGAHAGQFLGDQSFANDLQVAMAPQMALAYTGACSGGLPCTHNDGICPSNSPCSQGPKSAIEEARIPAVIVEVGYQTNPCQECAMRIQPGVIANAVAAGIANTFITPTFCASPADLKRSAERSTSKIPAPPLPAAPRRVVAKPTAPSQVLTFSEGFEGGAFPPSGWSIQTSGAPAPYAWARTTSAYYVGSGTAAGFIGGGYSSAKDEWLISPAIVLGAGDTGLQFTWVGNRVFASEVDMQVLAREHVRNSV
jgi:N-acetylmuramoyl-L-alanine amidase